MREAAPLAAIVSKADADEAIATLKRDGWYDSDRHIREAGVDTIAIPVTGQPSSTAVDSVVVQSDPPYRVRDLRDHLRERGCSADLIEQAPRSWAVIGDIIVVRFGDCPHPAVVGQALLDLYDSAHTVLAREGIEGAHREPSVRVIAGRGQTETVHVEAGTEYALDLDTVMFSPGNEQERQQMGTVVEPGETVLDMFAGIGYFSLPMARGGAQVTAIERNPAALAYLLENRQRNGIRDRISLYRGDCGEIVPKLAMEGFRADRIVMGHFDADAYLSAAFEAIQPGGMLHVHGIGHADSPFAELEDTIAEFDVAFVDRRVVKTHGPGTEHVIMDLRATGDAN